MEEMLTLIVNEDISLRQIEDADRERLAQLINREQEYLCQWLAENELKIMLEVGSFISISTMRYLMNGAFDAGIWYRDQLVGIVSLQTINPEKRRSSIGYWLDREYQGLGIVTQSVSKVVDYAFTVYGLQELRIVSAVDNRKSCAIPERIGFRLENKRTEAEKINGKFHDVAVYLLRKDVWTEMQDEQS